MMQCLMGDFKISDKMMRFSVFVPRLYNLCRSYGFEKGRIMPSRAFCSDENQGFPIILITKHFGAFPFNHGMVGGIVATDRHGQSFLLEQEELLAALRSQSTDNPDKIEMSRTIHVMEDTPAVKIEIEC